MRVDQTGHQQMPGRVNVAHPEISRSGSRNAITRLDRDDRIVLDRHGGLREFSARRIQRKHARAVDDGFHLAITRQP